MVANGIARPLLASVLFALGTVLISACAHDPTPANLTQQRGSADTAPLLQAVAAADLERVEQLVETGAPVNTLTEQGTPLARAVADGQGQIAWYLLSRGAAPDYVGADGVTPLMVAAANGQRRLVQLLLSAGADVNAEGRAGQTPVSLAARAGHLAVVRVLLTAGANVNVAQDGQSLLMHIVASGDLLTAEALLAAGADVNYRAPDGQSALDLARASGNHDLQLLLIQAGAR
ncbi:MAG: ankyrin repeat domain-containing protein [Marinobacter sp.]|uniref:ankyrin repeat domain-containing protein n=1 Tax=Marinobacter sp. TaxID=50741 RepID=UPI00299E15B3|nr:ankyrin repeat domain-containing protein [Marinobacter sp.]MDX1757934.1 ankyrin repeat domain-containing protein [Marinobacter sp.]